MLVWVCAQLFACGCTYFFLLKFVVGEKVELDVDCGIIFVETWIVRLN